MTDLPTVLGKSGMIPRTPADIRNKLITDVATVRPGYTSNLPGTLVEDISSTDVFAIVQSDTARVELINSLTPYGANEWLLNQIGAMIGVPVQDTTNTTVPVIFTGTPGFVINKGFIVGDGEYQYRAQDGGVVGAGGQSSPLSFVAVDDGTWSVAPGTVNQIITSVPSSITLSCSNPVAGTPGNQSQSVADYRTRVLQAEKASAIGMPSFTKTLLANVSGVVLRLISLQRTLSGKWKVIVGGGDPYEVAYAIYRGVCDPATLTGSEMNAVSISNEVNAKIITDLNHGYSVGQVVMVGDAAGMTGINNQNLTVVSIIDEKTFTTNFNSTLQGVYTGGGVLTPNFRNNSILIQDYPDLYAIPFISPPPQTVAITVLWNTSQTNYVNDGAIQQLGGPALASYINSIPAGQPINVYELERVFKEAIASVLSGAFVTRMEFDVSINGVGTSASPGTGIVSGDPESYFLTDATGANMTIGRG